MGTEIYNAPEATLDNPAEEEFNTATLGLRFANYIVDTLLTYFIIFVGMVAYIGVTGVDLEAELTQPMELVISMSVFFFYYVILEAAFGRTVGKFVTGTKVVNDENEKPSIGQALGRTLCRVIPFEPFSLFRSSNLGWHDTVPNTRVVKCR